MRKDIGNIISNKWPVIEPHFVAATLLDPFQNNNSYLVKALILTEREIVTGKGVLFRFFQEKSKNVSTSTKTSAAIPPLSKKQKSDFQFRGMDLIYDGIEEDLLEGATGSEY